MINTINYLTKMIPSKVMNLKKFPVFIVGALLLLQSGVTNARSLVVRDVARTVVVQTIPTHQGVDLHYVGLIRIIYKCPMDELFPSVKVAMERPFVRLAGLPLEKYCYCRLLRKMEKDMKDDVLTDLEKKVLIGKKLGVFDDFAGQQLLYCFSYGIQDKFIVGQIEKRVGHAQRRIALSGCPFLPPKLRQGDFVFGYDPWNNKLLTDVQYLNAHTLIVAGTGAGKTNLSKFRAIQIAPLVRGMWLIDIRKKEYRLLRPIFARMGIDLKIIRGRKFCVNPLEVPSGVWPIEYAAVVSDLLVKVLNLPPRASTLLKSTIIKLYQLYGILNGGDEFPTLFHLHKAIRENRGANPQARQAILDNLEAILLELGPEMLAYHRGWSVHELARQHLVMEFTGLTEQGKDLILATFLTMEFISRIARGISNPFMDLYIAMDEAQRLFSQHRDSSSYSGNALIDLVGLVRGTGVGLEISVLTTHNLSVNIPNLTSTKIIGRCGSEVEYTTAGHFAALNNEQIEWFANHSVPGLFAAQLGEGNHRYPFLLHVPLLNKHFDGDDVSYKGVSDKDADESSKNVASAVKTLPA